MIRNFVKRIFCVSVTILTLLLAGGIVAADYEPLLVSKTAPIVQVDGLSFKDLNKNGLLDPYEDWRLSPEERTEDLLQQMTLEEKAAQMIHLTLVQARETWFKDNNIGFALSYTYLADGPSEAANAANEIQGWSEASRLGIPPILSMDSVIGASWIRGATVIPDQIGLAATHDAELVKRLAAMQREEMKAVGVRMSLSPVADIATDPRWGRVQECFGEDPNQAAEMVVAAIEGLQAGRELTSDSVIACVKHFPGSGPQQDGIDGNPLIFNEISLPIHLSVFESVIEAGAGAIMPYGYSIVPFLGGDAATRNAHESEVIMTDLLRGQMGYDGIIHTDWGMKHVDSALAGADILGGAGPREIARLATEVPVEEMNDRVRRILNMKFALGLFENPYVDPSNAELVFAKSESKDLAFEAASRSLTLLKNEGVQLRGKRLVVAGALATDVDALSSGWKAPEMPGKSILQAVEDHVGAQNVLYVGDDASQLPDLSVMDGVAIVVVGEKAGTHQPDWGAKTLEFPEDQIQLVSTLHEAGLNLVTVVLLGRPYVMTELVELSDTVLIAYRPGVTRGADAVVSALLSESPITGSLPIQLPRSMEQVASQREDLPKDIIDPLFDWGYGIQVDSL